jgi:hypothetical protein
MFKYNSNRLIDRSGSAIQYNFKYTTENVQILECFRLLHNIIKYWIANITDNNNYSTLVPGTTAEIFHYQ